MSCANPSRQGCALLQPLSAGLLQTPLWPYIAGFNNTSQDLQFSQDSPTIFGASMKPSVSLRAVCVDDERLKMALRGIRLT